MVLASMLISLQKKQRRKRWKPLNRRIWQEQCSLKICRWWKWKTNRRKPQLSCLLKMKTIHLILLFQQSYHQQQQLCLEMLWQHHHNNTFVLALLQSEDQDSFHRMIPSCMSTLLPLALTTFRMNWWSSWNLNHYSKLFLWTILRFQVRLLLIMKQKEKPSVGVKWEIPWWQLAS